VLQFSKVDNQAALHEVAAEQGEVVPIVPFSTSGTWMRQAEMDGTTMTEWLFKRESPSKWMEGVIREVQKGIEAGWERHRSATAQATRRLAATAIETGLWSHTANTLINNWTAKEFRHITRQDEMVCELCRPKHNQIFSGASNGPPVHPRCRCIAVPAQTG